VAGVVQRTPGFFLSGEHRGKSLLTLFLNAVLQFSSRLGCSAVPVAEWERIVKHPVPKSIGCTL